MKKIVFYVLGLFLLGTLTFTACNKETHNQNESKTNSNNVAEIKSQELRLLAEIGENNELIEMFNKQELFDVIKNSGEFVEVEPVELNYLPLENLAFLTFIMRDYDDVAHAIQFTLTIDGNSIYLPKPIMDDGQLDLNVTSTHTCTGAPCSSCSFSRALWGIGWITGCKCNDSGSGNCNHTRTSGGSLVDKGVKLLPLIIAVWDKL